MSGLVILLFSTLTLICGITTFVNAQSSDNKKEVEVLKTLGKREVLGAVKRIPVLELSKKGVQKFDTDYKITMSFALPDGISLTKPTISITEVETENLKMTVMKGEKRDERGNSDTLIVSTALVTNTEPNNLELIVVECKSGSYIVATRDSSVIKKRCDSIKADNYDD